MSGQTLQRFLHKSSTKRLAATSLPPTFLLPFRAHLATAPTSSTITTTGSTDPNPPPNAYVPHNPPPPSHAPSAIPPTQNLPSASSSQPHAHPTRNPQLSRHTPFTHLPSPTTPEPTPALLQALAAQKPHYITAHIHERPYLLTEGDTLRLPFRMPHATPGTLLRLNRASILGSRDFTFRGGGISGGEAKKGGLRADRHDLVAGNGDGVGGPWIDEKYFICRALVVGVEGEPMRVILKTKRRQRRVKRVTSKGRFTVLRIVELRVRPGGEGDGEGAGMGGEMGEVENGSQQKLSL